MIRILIFLLIIVLFAGAVTFFAGMGGRIEAEAFGQKFNGPSGLIAGGFFVFAAALIYLTHFAKNLMALPAKVRARDEKLRRERGVTALTRGLEAVAVGDAADATHHARIAHRHLDDSSVTRLLTAQAAQLSGDDVIAKENFAAMLEAPETEFLGLRGLYAQAMAHDDRITARSYAERAYKLRPNARWAFESVLALGLARGAWGETRAALVQARRNNLLPAEKIDRGEAVLLTADASAAALCGELRTALGDAEAALKLAPGFVPAAALAARLHDGEGRKGKAAKIIGQAFAVMPHPALIMAYENLYTDEGAARRAEMAARLAAKAPQSREAAHLTAKQYILLEEWNSAIAAIEPLLERSPTAVEFSLMAQAFTGAHGAGAAKGWLDLAAHAPRDPRPGAEGEFHFTRDGWAQLFHEYMEHQRLAPPPLEEASYRLSTEEVRLLTAPPPAAAPVEAASAPAGADGPAPAGPSDADSDDHIHNDEETERAASAAREVS